MKEIQRCWLLHSFKFIKYLSKLSLLFLTFATFNLGNTCQEKFLITTLLVTTELIFDFLLVKLKYKKKYKNRQFEKQNISTIDNIFMLDIVSTIEIGLLLYLREGLLFWLIGLFVYISIAYIIILHIDDDEIIQKYLKPIELNTYNPKKQNQ